MLKVAETWKEGQCGTSVASRLLGVIEKEERSHIIWEPDREMDGYQSKSVFLSNLSVFSSDLRWKIEVHWVRVETLCGQESCFRTIWTCSNEKIGRDWKFYLVTTPSISSYQWVFRIIIFSAHGAWIDRIQARRLSRKRRQRLYFFIRT